MRQVLASLGILTIGLFAACGDDTSEAEDELETSCLAFCDTLYGTDCASPGISLDQCKQACPLLKTQLGGYCVAEYTTVFDCTSQGGVTCTENGPIPNATCSEENLSLQTCLSDAACERFCDTAVEAGCPPGGTASACKTSCQSKKDALGLCESVYDGYLQCTYSYGGLSCSGGTPTSENCDETLTSVGGCIASTGDACQGYCFSSEALGCGEAAACEASCAATRDQNAACTSTYESWLSCAADAPESTCGADGLTSTWCDSEWQSYQTCAGG